MVRFKVKNKKLKKKKKIVRLERLSIGNHVSDCSIQIGKFITPRKSIILLLSSSGYIWPKLNDISRSKNNNSKIKNRGEKRNRFRKPSISFFDNNTPSSFLNTDINNNTEKIISNSIIHSFYYFSTCQNKNIYCI